MNVTNMGRATLFQSWLAAITFYGCLQPYFEIRAITFYSGNFVLSVTATDIIILEKMCKDICYYFLFSKEFLFLILLFPLIRKIYLFSWAAAEHDFGL